MEFQSPKKCSLPNEIFVPELVMEEDEIILLESVTSKALVSFLNDAKSVLSEEAPVDCDDRLSGVPCYLIFSLLVKQNDFDLISL